MTLPLTLYRAVTGAAPFLMTGVLRRRHRGMGGDDAQFAERRVTAPPPRPDGLLIWIHAASVGEVTAVAPLALRLADARRAGLLVTTFTITGHATARRLLPGAVVQLAPLDLPGPVRRFLDHWRPDMGLFVEGDLWPRLTLAAGAQVPLALLNARPSRSRARFPVTFARLLAPFRAVTCQSQDLIPDLRRMGFARDAIAVTGDLKAASPLPPADPGLLAALQTAIGDRPVWLALSTHRDDERAVLTAHQIVRGQHPDALLIMAPRHPDRAGGIGATAADLSLPLTRRSAGDPPKGAVYLADTLGEVGLWLRLAQVAFLGGSFGQEGGHNPYEAAAAGLPVLSGPRTAHFATAYQGLFAAGAAKVVDDGTDLGLWVHRLLANPGDMGARAQGFHATQAGAIDRTLAHLAARLP